MSQEAAPVREVDFGAAFDERMACEFVRHSAEATMATMTSDPVVLHVPTSSGGSGNEDVCRFYLDYFVDAFPPAVEVSNITRTIGDERLVDELVVSFTHTCEMPIFLARHASGGGQEVALVPLRCASQRFVQ
jgi:carboxymethylenebutenolidase